jgi:glycine/serine hydroxymethyltransferase
MMDAPLSQVDPDLFTAMEAEVSRQQSTLDMIAPETSHREQCSRRKARC